MKESIKLESGLLLITDKIVKSSTVTFSVYFAVGSNYENEKKAGVTALTMNMFFRRLNNLNQAELYSSMEKLGGEIKGNVSMDYTCFEFTVLSCFASEALDLILKLFEESTWTQEDLEKEKKVTLKKIEFSGTDYDFCLSKQTGIKSFTRSIKGTKESIEGITLSELNEWKQKYFIPSNACMVLTGNFDGKIKKECIKILGKKDYISNPEKKSFIPLKAFNRSSKEFIYRKIDDDPAEIRLFFDVDLTKIKMEEFLTVVNLFGLGNGGKLPYFLKDENAFTDDVDFDVHYTENYAGIDIDFFVNSSDVELALEIIGDCIFQMKNNISMEFLNTGILFNTLNESRNYDSSEGLASLYGYYDFILKKPYSVEESVSSKETISPKRIMAISREIFKPENTFLCIKSKLKKADVIVFAEKLCHIIQR